VRHIARWDYGLTRRLTLHPVHLWHFDYAIALNLSGGPASQ